MFNKNSNVARDKTIYQARPNMLLGCKKAIFGIILLIFVLYVSSPIIQVVGQLQVYLISRIKLPLTRYTAIGIFVVILIIILYIIWQLILWYSMEYIITETKIIVKSGILFNHKNYMPFSAIQDINTSQSIFARLINVGSISIYSAYDNNQMELNDISNPEQVEEIIFSKISQPRQFSDYQNKYVESNHDEVEVITPIKQDVYPKNDYDYYPENLNFEDSAKKHNYEYEPYDVSNLKRDSDNLHYNNEVVNDYSNSSSQYFKDNEASVDYNDYDYENYQEEQNDIGQTDDSSEKVIKRHFDKFKK